MFRLGLQLSAKIRPASALAQPAVRSAFAAPSVRFPRIITPVRFASTNPENGNAASKPQDKQSVLHHTERFKETTQVALTWNQFFQLRKRRRYLGVASSVFTALFASATAFQYFANLVIDFDQQFMGIEMQWIYLAGIVASGFFGWLLGPLVGNGVFNLAIGSRGPLFHQMDNVFLRHISRNQPNPTKHNVNTNPLPDYYGEKIGSIHDYRQWLREGRLFAKKAENFF